MIALQQETGVLELLGLRPGLAQGVQTDAGDNQYGGPAEGQLGVDLQQHDQHRGNQGHEEQIDGSNRVQPVHHV